jgi:cytochrome c-type biogenesis protein CcmH/NrfG
MPVQSIDNLVQQARQALAQKELDEARDLYQQALAIRPTSPEVHYGLGTVHFLMNDLHKAAQHFKEVTRLDPSRAGAFINLGSVYYRLDQLDEAINVLRRGIQLDTRRAEGYYNLGVVYRQKGQLRLALQAYSEAVRLNPRLADAHLNLANVYAQMENYRQAVRYYEEALELRPGWENAEQGLANAQAALQASETTAEEPEAPEEEQPAALPAPSADLDRAVDPAAQGAALTVLHSATIESEAHGRQVLEILEREIEPAIKLLSSCLLLPDAPASDLDERMKRFVSAMTNLRGAQRSLETGLRRVQNLTEQLIQQG